jgi:hypothetical protein
MPLHKDKTKILVCVKYRREKWEEQGMLCSVNSSILNSKIYLKKLWFKWHEGSTWFNFFASWGIPQLSARPLYTYE